MRRTKQNKNKHEKRIYIEKLRWCSATKLIYVSILNKPAVQAFSSQARGCCCSRKHHFETPKKRRKWGESAPTLMVAISTLPNLPMSKTQRCGYNNRNTNKQFSPPKIRLHCRLILNAYHRFRQVPVLHRRSNFTPC